MDKIKEQFDQTFSHWSIQLPSDDITRRRSGRICRAGWVISYLFGTDGGGEYLDYYASHRMTNDRHVRIRANGECESLPAIQDFRVVSDDPKEDARLKAEYFAHNQRVAAMLNKKGFGLRGDEPLSMQINRHLHLNDVNETGGGNQA